MHPMRAVTSGKITPSSPVATPTTKKTEDKGSIETQLVARVPPHSRGELLAIASRGAHSVSDRNSTFNMLCRSLATPSPERLFVDTHESALHLLSGLARFCETGSLGFSAPNYLSGAVESYQRDCKSIYRAFKSIRGSKLSKGVHAPLSQVQVDGGFEGWMGAMKDLAIYRKALTPSRQAGLMRYRERRLGKEDMHHNFTRVGMKGVNNVLIHNTKAKNGEGATRVMSLVAPTGPGTFSLIRPDHSAVDRIFDRDHAAHELGLAQTQLLETNKTIQSLQSSHKKLTTSLETAPEPKQEGIKKGIAACEQKLKRPLADKEELERAIEELGAAASQPTPKMLDLSYDDIFKGLEQLQRAHGWGDAQMAGALLDLVVGGGSRKTITALCEPLTIKGIKVKDVLNPRQDPETADVQMSGLDLCQTLLSIMFLTEPKHALPMAVANHDALKAVVCGAVPLRALFAPIELQKHDGQLNFVLGGESSNLGALLASANNLRTVLDPSDPTQRKHKELAMPLCELESLNLSQESLGAILRGEDLPETDRGRAAVLFPVLKSLLMRALVEKHQDKR